MRADQPARYPAGPTKTHFSPRYGFWGSSPGYPRHIESEALVEGRSSAGGVGSISGSMDAPRNGDGRCSSECAKEFYWNSHMHGQGPGSGQFIVIAHLHARLDTIGLSHDA